MKRSYGYLILAIVLLLGTLLLFQPRWLLKLISELFPGPLYFVETSAPILALTIDDGPDPGATPKILEVLSRHQAKATFFLISGRVPGNEAIVSAIVEQGHELGNHLTRNEASIKLSAAEFEAQLLEADAVLSRFAVVRWVRPGSGWYNSEMMEIIHRHNYRCALGSVFPYDVQIPWRWFTIHYLLLNIHPGAILILHDVGSLGERTASVLDTVLPELHRRGYRIVSLSELAGRAVPINSALGKKPAHDACEEGKQGVANRGREIHRLWTSFPLQPRGRGGQCHLLSRRQWIRG